MNKDLISIRKITLSALFVAIGWILPFLTGQIPEVGNMLLPMHIPVMLAGFILGPFYGLLIGILTPITRTLIFGMPPLYPQSISMMIELGTYGFVCGFLYKLFKEKTKLSVYPRTLITLIISMILGRCMWGIARSLSGILDSSLSFTWIMFMSGAFITAWPGIIIQILIIPPIVVALDKAKKI